MPVPAPDIRPDILESPDVLLQHDSYHIGQLALLRKHAGHPQRSMCEAICCA